LPGGELIDRRQNTAGNVADRQYLNSRRLRQWGDGSGALTSSCPKINPSPLSPATLAGSVVIVLFIYIYLFPFVWVVVAGGP
jgi:hypothetical protein